MTRLMLMIGLFCFSCCGNSGSRKVFYINSYHKGYAASDSIEAAIRENLPASVSLQVFHLDAKRNAAEVVDSIAKVALSAIDQFRPDLIIASDDDAVKRLIVPYFSNTEIPVVFCGVNWSASAYGLTDKNITGMVEVLPLVETLLTIRNYYKPSEKLTVLSENTVSEQRNKLLLDTLYRRIGLSPNYILVDDFSEWKRAFVDANEHSDIVYLPTNGGIKGWEREEAIAFVQRHIKKPVVTCDDFMMPYAVMGFTKVAREQGEWAANTALRILNGEHPSKIALTKNIQKRGWFNPLLAAKIGFSPDRELLIQLQSIQ